MRREEALHLRFFGHNPQRAPTGDNDGGCGVRKRQHFIKLLLVKAVYPVRQHGVQQTGGERIAGARGIDGPNVGKAAARNREAAIPSPAAPPPHRHADKPCVAARPKPGEPLVCVALAGYEFELVVRDFQNVAVPQAELDFFPRIRRTVPERQAKVRIEGAKHARLSGIRHGRRVASSAAGKDIESEPK